MAALATNDGQYPVTSNYLALAGDMSQATEAIQANQQGRAVSMSGLDIITVPSGGRVTWEVPDILTGVRSERVLEGIIMTFTTPRAYWPVKVEDSDGDKIPDCSSPDSLEGAGNPGGDCLTCHLAVYQEEWIDGSGKIRTGTPCQEQWRLLFLMRDAFIPVVVQVPYMSMKVFQKFFSRLTSKGLPFYSVEFGLSLEKTKQSGGGLEYSRIVPSILGQLSPDEVGRVKAYQQIINPTERE